MVKGKTVTVTVTKKAGESSQVFGAGTYTLGVTGATAKAVTTTTDQKELTFTLTVGTENIVVTSLTKAGA